MTDRNNAEIMYPHQNGDWRIELRYRPIAHRGHAFLALVKGKDEVVEQLHGLSQSRNTNGIVPVGMDGARLFATDAGNSGQIQNSNSVAFTLGKAMGLDQDLDRVLRETGMARTFSGWGRDLLDPKYERYVAPPTFPVRDAP